MGFMDSIRDRLGGGRSDAYEDDYYDDGYEDDPYGSYSDEPAPRGRSRSDQAETGHGLLGNPSRPTAESISVYTRGGELVDSNFEGFDSSAPAPYARNARVRDDEAWTDSRLDYSLADDGYAAARPAPAPAPAPSYATSARVTSGKLPAYVIAPVAYDDVEAVMRRVRTNQPVVLNFRATNIEVAKRVLDFCFGLSCGLGGRVDELGERAFVVLPAGVELSDQDVQKLQRDGIISQR